MCKNSKENELKDLLIKIRRNKKTMRDLVELLEGNDYLDENKGDTEYQLFCEEYVSYIIQKYVSDEKR